MSLTARLGHYPDARNKKGIKAEGLEVAKFGDDAAGNGFVITDNDGVADSSGETFFWSIGAMN